MQFSHIGRVRILYKSILKLHRGLPEGLKLIGDNYVKDEFKRHKGCSSEETKVFMNEWTNYAISLANQLGIRGPTTAKPLGNQLNDESINHMTDEQIYQLYELMMAAQSTEDVPKK